jgi:hypothetical protein
MLCCNFCGNIKKLKSYGQIVKFDIQETQIKYNYDCAICFEVFEEKIKILILNKCEHAYHLNCFKKYCEKLDDDNILKVHCPLCRITC